MRAQWNVWKNYAREDIRFGRTGSTCQCERDGSSWLFNQLLENLRRKTLCSPYRSSTINGAIVLPKGIRHGNAIQCNTCEFEGVKIVVCKITVIEFIEWTRRKE
jgi:hypothetical protein